MKKLFFFVAVLGCIYACKKDSDHETDTQKPSIVIIEPMANDSFAASDSVHIEFTLNDNDELHEMKMEIMNASDSVLFSDSAHLDQASYSYHKHYHPAPVSSVTALKLNVRASDHHDNTESKMVQFYIKP